jgi:isoquinoline 1-oxidoreductase beta subunit
MIERTFNRRRRCLIQAAAATAAGLVVPLRLGARPTGGSAFQPNAFVRIGPDGRVVLTVQRTEMGQGIRTALAMVLCDELDADWSRVAVEQADGDSDKYGDQNTVGDFSLVVSWTPLRMAAAAARDMLLRAAARRLNVDAKLLRTEAGRVVLPNSHPARSLSYGALAEAAAREEISRTPALKAASGYRLIGRALPGVDLRAQTTGTLTYGMDVQRPGLLYAVVLRAPAAAMDLKHFDTAAAITVSGVHAVFALPAKFAPEGATFAGVAVVARNSWACMKARGKLQVEWACAPDSLLPDSIELRRQLDASADKTGVVMRSAGDLDGARRLAAKTLKRRYYTPMQTHAPMEPPNCTVELSDGHCEVWAPTQNPADARERVAAELGWPQSRVTVHVTALGGGFGRKSMHDFVLEAVRVAREVKRPVKLFWTREDDLRHGYFRTPSLQELEGGLDAKGELLFWRHHTVHSSQQPTSTDAPVSHLDFTEAYGGAARWPYAVPHLRVEGSHVDVPVKRSWMRGVQDTFHAFAAECFFDELATLAGRDPVAWRVQLLGPPRRIQFIKTRAETDLWFDTGRYAAVIRRAAERAGWGQPQAQGYGLGFASQVHGPTYVAMVAQVQRAPAAATGFRVVHITCVVDCGLVVNPDSARAQVEGAIAFGLSGALHGAITLQQGAVVQSNFHDYPIARLADMPRVDVEFLQGGDRPLGLGEPCVPVVAPAIANALAAAGLGRMTEWPLRVAESALAATEGSAG